MKPGTTTIFATLFGLVCISFLACDTSNTKPFDKLEAKYEPSEQFFLQRSYPDKIFNINAYEKGLKKAKQQSFQKSGTKGFEEEWVVQGPGNIGARVNTIAIHPANPNIIYAGFSSGGLYKTTNGGENWIPVFDDQLFMAIGDIAIDPNAPETIYAGTGDPNISGYPFIGNGVYKSIDGGESWQHIGLVEQRIVSKIIVDPSNSDVIYVSTMGLPFERNDKRGLYKSIDGGGNWEQILFVSNQAGIIDMVINPKEPQILYAASWDRIRNNQESTTTGLDAKIFKTADGGESWLQLTEGLPIDIEMSRIGLAISASHPDTLCAMYVGTDHQLHGVYRSETAGAEWYEIDTETSTGISDNVLGGFGWYFGMIRINPFDPSDVFLLGVDLWRFDESNTSWSKATPPWWHYSVHADKHDLTFLSADTMILATDGGIYKSDDNAENWYDLENIPTTQFYRVAYNPHIPDFYYGGTQDNGTTGGNLDFFNEWDRIFGGDGFQAIFHPENPDIFYAESQRGNIYVTENGGESWSGAGDGLDPDDRFNWDMQYIISPHNPDVLYTGTHRLYKSTIGAMPFWEPVSEDLTDGVIFEPMFHSITTLTESPVKEGVVYTGSSDGNVWRTEDGGEGWLNISGDLPDRYVTDIKASPEFENTVYVTHSGYKDNEFIPRVHRSLDRGETWNDISGDLPNLAVNDIYIVPFQLDTIIFIGTDGGVYGTVNEGANWERLGENMPFIAVYDLEWNQEKNELIAGTFGRSIMTYPLDSILTVTDTSSVPVKEIVPIAQKLEIYPSPTSEFINIHFTNTEPGRSYEMVIINAEGRIVLSKKGGNAFENFEERIDVSTFSSGFYAVKIKIRHTILSGKFLKL
ncbi:MAG: T9SS type A sorting domain-containing protein [Bacteroidetes bacterium]|nr:T9SS type A sorting domain-containing protein [Bacteroidota bacterium]